VGPRRPTRWVVGAVTATTVVGGVAASLLISHESTATSVPGVREVIVETGVGPVTLRGGESSSVGIRSTPYGLLATSSAPEFELDDGVLRITSTCSGVASSCFTQQEITVPAGVPVRVDTGVGDVTAVDLDVPSFTVSAGAATVTASFVSAPEEVRISAGAAGNVEISLPDAGYRVDTDATVGTEEVRVDRSASAPGSIDASTGVGNITVRPR
jgi:hypothetical protein